MPTAILVDCGYFLKQFPIVYPDNDSHDPKVVVQVLYERALSHVNALDAGAPRALHKILCYDCPPRKGRIVHPLTGEPKNFGTSDTYNFRTQFHRELTGKRKVALRLGELGDGAWVFKQPLEKLVRQGHTPLDILSNQVRYIHTQKGVDMKIGIDIAMMSIRRIVSQMVLISGDADFVPAAKLARREGVDFILDPMGKWVIESLREHIDDLHDIGFVDSNRHNDDGSPE